MLDALTLRIAPAKSRAAPSAAVRRGAGVEWERAQLAAVMLRIDPAKSRAAPSAAERRSAGIERERAMLATVMLRISPAKSRADTSAVRRSGGIACRVLTLVNSQRATISEQPRGIGKPWIFCGTNAGPSELPPAAVLGFRDCFSYCDHH